MVLENSVAWNIEFSIHVWNSKFLMDQLLLFVSAFCDCQELKNTHLDKYVVKINVIWLLFLDGFIFLNVKLSQFVFVYFFLSSILLSCSKY